MSACRMCAGVADPGVCLLDPAQQRLAACARDNLNISISADDGYPTRICMSCADDLRKWMAFRDRNQKALSLFTKVLATCEPPVLSCPPSGVRVAPSLPQSGGGTSPDTCSVAVRTGTREETARESSQVTENIQPEVRPARTFLDKWLQPSQTPKSPVVAKSSTNSAVMSYDSLAAKFSLRELRVSVTRLSEEELASLGQTKTWPGQKKVGCSLPQGRETASSKAGSPKPARDSSTRCVGGAATNQQASSCGQDLSDSCSAGRKTLCGGEQLTEEEASLLSQTTRDGEQRFDLQSITRPRLLPARHKTSPGGVRAKSRVPGDCDKGRRPRCDVGAPPEISPPNLDASKEDRKFSCDHCGKVLKYKSSLSHHIRNYHKEAPGLFKCKLCGSTFKMLRELSAHKRSSHTLSDLKVHSCNHCDQKFKHLSEVRIHTERHHNNGARPFKCGLCGKLFKTKYNASVHLKYYHGDTKYPCSICGKMFKSTGNLKSHQERNHNNGVRPYKCSLCGVSFKVKPDVNRHIIFKHLNLRKYSCTFCTQKFKTSSERSCHEKRLHTKGPRVQCDQCPASFKVKEDLAKHKRHVHSSRPKLSCHQCERKFKYKLTLRDHMDRDHGDGLCHYKCTVCQAAFITVSGLYSHRSRKHIKVKSIL